MNKLKRSLSMILAASMIAAACVSCGEKTGNSSGTDSQELSAQNSGSITETGEIETFYDPDFSIELVGDGIKKVTDGDGRELVLVPREMNEVPEEYADSIVIRTPVQNAVLLSSTQVCTFRTVDDPEIISAIGGVEGSADEWSDISAISEGIKNGDIMTVGDGMTEPDYEQIQALNPDVVFVYSGEYGQQSQMAKLDELGINYAVDNDYIESDYLARMEWMRFLLTFFDADSEAEAAMANVRENIEKTKLAIEGKEKPVVAIFSAFDGVIYPTYDGTWIGSMVADMGGVNAFSELPMGTITFETAFECINDADVIIYSSTSEYTSGMTGVIDEFPQLTECRAYDEGRVFQYSASFWHSIDQSDVMACDLAAALYPEQFADRNFSYFIKLEK